MVKRAQIKKKSKKRKIKKSSKKIEKKSSIHVEKTLIENFIALQKVMTNLSSKFDNLANQISKLLELFEISAKVLSEKEAKIEKGESDKKVAEKVDKLLDQNKIIARGLTLLHETKGENIPQPPKPLLPPQQKLPPQLKRAPIEEGKTKEMGGYQKSISSQNKEYEE